MQTKSLDKAPNKVTLYNLLKLGRGGGGGGGGGGTIIREKVCNKYSTAIVHKSNKTQDKPEITYQTEDIYCINSS